MSERGPAPRGATIRELLRQELRGGWVSALQLSSLVGISESAVPGHLEHLRKSVSRRGGRFEVDPSVCPECDFVFRERARLTRPSRCPKCRCERMPPPRFRIVER